MFVGQHAFKRIQTGKKIGLVNSKDFITIYVDSGAGEDRQTTIEIFSMAEHKEYHTVLNFTTKTSKPSIRVGGYFLLNFGFLLYFVVRSVCVVIILIYYSVGCIKKSIFFFKHRRNDLWSKQNNFTFS